MEHAWNEALADAQFLYQALEEKKKRNTVERAWAHSLYAIEKKEAVILKGQLKGNGEYH